MKNNRRDFLKLSGLAGLGMSGMNILEGFAAGASQTNVKMVEAISPFQLNDQITAAYQIALNILKPSKKELERGLELHRDAVVIDCYGFMPRAAVDGNIITQAIEDAGFGGVIFSGSTPDTDTLLRAACGLLLQMVSRLPLFRKSATSRARRPSDGSRAMQCRGNPACAMRRAPSSQLPTCPVTMTTPFPRDSASFTKRTPSSESFTHEASFSSKRWMQASSSADLHRWRKHSLAMCSRSSSVACGKAICSEVRAFLLSEGAQA